MNESDQTPIVLSIVVLTFNEKFDTVRCISSLLEFIDDRSEIILVDNGSSDGTVEAIGTLSSKVRIFRSDKNLGVGPGRNYGVDQASGEYIMIIDNDTIYYGPEPVHEIQHLFATLPKAGVIGFQLLNEDGSLQRNFRRFPVFLQPFVARVSILKKVPFLNSILDSYLMTEVPESDLYSALEVDFVIGANQVFSRKEFLRMGKYDEEMFYGVEDCELCLRFKKEGYKNYYSPAVRIAHVYKRRSRHSLKLFTSHLFSFVHMFRKHKRVYRLYP